MRSPEHHCRMSKITNDGLTQSGTECFIAAVPYDGSGRRRVKLDHCVSMRVHCAWMCSCEKDEGAGTEAGGVSTGSAGAPALRSQLRAAHLKILLQADELQRRTQLERQHWHPRTLSPSVRDFSFH